MLDKTNIENFSLFELLGVAQERTTYHFIGFLDQMIAVFHNIKQRVHYGFENHKK